MSNSAQNTSIVLVHGAWADNSGWSQVILPLQREGFAVTSAPIPLTSLTDDSAALQRTLERTTGPVVLVGHAYAGAVIATALNDQVKALVYIAALAPDEGETVAKVFYREEPHSLAPHLAPDAHGFIWMPAEGFRNAVAHNAPPDVTAVLAAVQRPIALRCIQEPSPAPAWKTKPTWYLLAEQDRMINPRTQRFMADRMRATVRAHPVDHSPMLTAPDLVVNIIREAANSDAAMKASS
jgi:pimeloyl-ACP methyl ester carboxylesterase